MTIVNCVVHFKVSKRVDLEVLVTRKKLLTMLGNHLTLYTYVKSLCCVVHLKFTRSMSISIKWKKVRNETLSCFLTPILIHFDHLSTYGEHLLYIVTSKNIK